MKIFKGQMRKLQWIYVGIFLLLFNSAIVSLYLLKAAKESYETDTIEESVFKGTQALVDKIEVTFGYPVVYHDSMPSDPVYRRYIMEPNQVYHFEEIENSNQIVFYAPDGKIGVVVEVPQDVYPLIINYNIDPHVMNRALYFSEGQYKRSVLNTFVATFGESINWFANYPTSVLADNADDFTDDLRQPLASVNELNTFFEYAEPRVAEGNVSEEFLEEYNRKSEELRNLRNEIGVYISERSGMLEGEWGDFVEANIEIKIVKNEKYQTIAKIAIISLIIFFLSGLVSLRFIYSNSYTALIRRFKRAYGCEDEKFIKNVKDEFRDQWLKADVISVIERKIDLQFRLWDRKRLVIERRRNKRAQKKEALPKGVDLNVQTEKEKSTRVDPRKERRLKRKAKSANTMLEDVSTPVDQIEEVFDHIAEIELLAGGALQSLEFLSIEDLEILSEIIKEMKLKLPKRIRNLWFRQFDGENPSTFRVIFKVFKKKQENKWDKIRDIIKGQGEDYQKELSGEAVLTLSIAIPLLTGERVIVIGGQPSLKPLYINSLIAIGASKVRWFDGGVKDSRIAKQNIDLVILLRRGLSHATSFLVDKSLSDDAKVIVLNADTRSTFIQAVIKELS